MNVPRKFVWLGDDDDKLTHLKLKKNQIYNSGDVSEGILIAQMREGKLKFIDDGVSKPPPDVVLEVQKGTIPMNDLLEHIDGGLRGGN